MVYPETLQEWCRSAKRPHFYACAWCEGTTQPPAFFTPGCLRSCRHLPCLGPNKGSMVTVCCVPLPESRCRQQLPARGLGPRTSCAEPIRAKAACRCSCSRLLMVRPKGLLEGMYAPYLALCAKLSQHSPK